MLAPQPIYESMTPFEWVSSHLQLVGWPVLIYLAWKSRGVAEKFIQDWKTLETRSQLTLVTVNAVKDKTDEMSNNHLKHMEVDLAAQTVLLESIDKNIAILVDRRL